MENHPKILHTVYAVKCVTKSIEILGDTPSKILEPKNFDLISVISRIFRKNFQNEQDIVNGKSINQSINQSFI